MKNLGRVLFLAALALAAGCRQDDPTLRSDEEESMAVIKGEIELGSEYEAEIAGGEQHVWTWTVPAGQFAELQVAKLGIDLTVCLFPPGADEPELKVSGLNGEWGTERLSAVAESEDIAYRVEIVPNSESVEPGGYRLVASEPRIATDVDPKNVAAERTFDSAERLRREGGERNLEQALESYRRALEDFEGTGEVEGRLMALHRVGLIQERLGARAEARQVYQTLLELSRELGRRSVEAQTLNRLGRLDYNEGREEEAEKRIGEALVIAKELDDAPLRATCLNNLASIAYRREALASALEQFETVREIWEELGRPREQADALFNKSRVLRAQGLFVDAFDALEQARALRQDNDLAVATILVQMATLERWLGKLEQARELYEEAFAVGADKLSGSLRVTMSNDLGLILAEIGEEDLAMTRFEEALAEADRLRLDRHEAMAALNLGALRRSRRQLTEAAELVGRARTLFGKLEDRRNLAACGLIEAQILRDQGHLDAALTKLTAAVEHVEALRLDHDGLQFRMAFFATRQGYYDELIELFLELHAQDGDASNLEEALHVGERRRARSLLDALAEGKLHYRGEPSLLDHEQRLTIELAEVDAELRLSTVDEAEELKRRQRQLLLKLESVRIEIRRTSPQYSELTRPQPLDVEAIRTEVLDTGTRLLVYSLGKLRSFLWTLGHKEPLEVFELPGRQEIEAAVTAARDAFGSRAQHRQTNQRIELEYLSDLLLGPIAASLDRRRLAVVADGALQTIPFSALPEPDASAANDGPRSWLIEGREVVHLPSASSLAALRHEIGDRRPAPYAVAVFADPIFSVNDPRLENEGDQQEMAPPKLDLALRDFDSGQELPRLPATAAEAGVIKRLVDVRHRMIASSFEASRKTFEELDLSKYRILHFATHGLLDSVHPELSGLVLSLIDEEKRPVNGFIRAHELYKRQLGADLVVLSACETGLGREVRGEGIVGLPRGFLYAGVPRVVVSLWNVADESTAHLMETFYEALDRGQTPSAALRKAQLAMLRSDNEAWRLPFYWGAFAFVGEWRRGSGPGRGIDQDELGGILIDEPDKGTAYEEFGDSFEAGARAGRAPSGPEIWGRAWDRIPTDDLVHPVEFLNGVDAETGGFLTPDPRDNASAMHLEPRDYRRLRHWVQYYHPEDPTRLPLHGVDPEDLAQAGWAVVFGPGVSDDARVALDPLLKMRRRQAGSLYRRLDYAIGTDALKFLEDEAGAFGPADPQKLPYYVLLVGDPSELPFEFQHQIDVQYAVGRLHFKDDEDYGRYAQAVVDAEAASAGEREAVFWGTDIPDDPHSGWMMAGLVRPLVDNLRAWRSEHGLYDVATATDGCHSTLAHLLGDTPPAFLFTASHGMVFSDQDIQREHQGAFLCEDCAPWQRGQPVQREHYFSAEDLPLGLDLRGLIAFHFACYSAGCNARDDFERSMLGKPRRLAPRAFVSRMSQRLLTAGAQAVVGHVDRAWTTSFSWENHGDQTRVFASMLRQLFRGHRLGHATEWVHYRYAECSTYFNRLLEAKLEELRLGIDDPDSLLYRQLRKATLDARNYLVIGDPAVRLVGADERRLQQSKTA